MNGTRQTVFPTAFTVTLCWLLLLGTGRPIEANALDVRIDFNDNVAAPSGWNLVADPSNTNTVHDLLDYHTGLDTNIDLRIDIPFIDSGQNIAPFPWSNQSAPWVVADVLRDYGVLTGDTDARIVLSNLGAVAYQVELLSVRGVSSTSDTSYLVNGLPGAVVDGGGSSADWNAQNDGYVNQDFMRWSRISPNGSGQLIIDVSTPSNYAFLNGMRLTAVPEPAAASLWIVGALLVLSSRTRRRCRRATGPNT